MTEYQRVTLTEYLDRLGGMVAVLSPRKQRYTRRYIAEQHGLNRQCIHYIERGMSDKFSDAMAARVVAAVREESAKAGLNFPDSVFIEYLAHVDDPVVNPRLPGEGGATAPGEGDTVPADAAGPVLHV